MKSKAAQWILWAITMVIFLALTLSGHFDWLIVAMIVSSLVWYTVVPRATSRQQ
jgi:membrane protein implicated in regulation of membrane protease activity